MIRLCAGGWSAGELPRKRQQRQVRGRVLPGDNLGQRNFHGLAALPPDHDAGTAGEERMHCHRTGFRGHNPIAHRRPSAALDVAEDDDASETRISRDRLDDAHLAQLRVVELRSLARRVDDFPIKGRDVARAGRDELLAAFRALPLA